MDKEKKAPEQEDGDSQPSERPRHQHVHIFGAEMGGPSSDDRDDRDSNGGDMSPEDRVKRREERRKMQREQWRYDHPHTGGLFWGLLLVFVGAIALLHSMGLIATGFWHAIEPFWPVLLILWGASIILGRHWFARLVLFIVALILLVIVIIYGLAKTGSPVVSYLSPAVVQAVQSVPSPRQ